MQAQQLSQQQSHQIIATTPDKHSSMSSQLDTSQSTASTKSMDDENESSGMCIYLKKRTV